MTPWEYSCCIEGWVEANGSGADGKTGTKDLPAMDYDEFKEFMAS
jgi:hypothetical protein